MLLFYAKTVMASLTATNNEALPQEMVDFLNEAWTCFHAIEACKSRLNGAGYTEISERSVFKGQIKQGGKYYFTRNDSSIVAFAIGSKYEAGNGFIAIGAHSDSPCLKLKPNSKITSVGYQQIGLQTYGGVCIILQYLVFFTQLESNTYFFYTLHLTGAVEYLV